MTATTEIESVRVRPWPDAVIDTLGHDPRSLYAERFWLPTLGPTSLLLLRHLAHRFEELGVLGEGTIEVPLLDTAVALGLGPRGGPSSPVRKAMERLVTFDLAYPHADATLAVRRSVPPISRRHVRRLPPFLVAEHERWVRADEPPREGAARRARHIALTLVETGSDVDVVERTLHQIGFRPLVCREAATWAQARHRAVERADAPTATEPGRPSHRRAHDLPDVA